MSVRIWKTGSNWGKGKPLNYNFMKKEGIVVVGENHPFQTGDLVIISSGHSVRAITQVNSPLIPVTNRPQYELVFKNLQIPFDDRHFFVEVKWIELAENQQFKYRVEVGICGVRDKKTIKTIHEIWDSMANSNQKINSKTTNSMNKSPLNQILYGPPGTGKTYRSINEAIKIIAPEFDLKQDRKLVKAKFDQLQKAGQIMFTTFHQSMSYEDFVEGIKPQEPTPEQPQVWYKVEPGIFRQICKNAADLGELKVQKEGIFNGVRFYKMSLGGMQRADIYEWCLENNCLAMGWGGDVNFKTYKNISDWAAYRDKFVAEHPELVKESRFNITAMFGLQNMKTGDIVAISKGNKIIDAIGRVSGDYFWDDKSPFGYFQFRKIEWLAKNINQNPSLFFNKNITQQSIYQFYDVDVKKEAFVNFFKETPKKSAPHVLIIDEINRGNVSQIFGELITLIEEDKRLGNPEALQITLPYSKDEPFGVPSNLYIIGTMNTADRSVEALDTALRRRFSFVEMQPDYGLLSEVSGIRLGLLLKTINRRIEKLLDRDHLIGHSYFLKIEGVAGLQDAFYKSIVPLLQEYFFGDFGKIGLVLGEGFFEDEQPDENKKNIFAQFKAFEDAEELAARKIFRLKNISAMTTDEFKNAIAELQKNSA